MKTKIKITILFLCILAAVVLNKSYANAETNQDTSYADKKLENIIGPFTSGLDKILQLETYNYTYKDDKAQTPHVGVMAQDLQNVFPNAVSSDDKGYLRIRHEDMFFAMINSIKQLDITVKELAKNVKLLFTNVKSMENKLVLLTKSNQNNTNKIDKLNKEAESLLNERKELEAKISELKNK